MVAKTSVCPYSFLLFFVSDVRLRFVSSVVSLRRAYSCGVGHRCFILLIYFGVGRHGDADQQSENLVVELEIDPGRRSTREELSEAC